MIRPATPADHDAVRSMVRAAYAPYVARIGREPGPMGEDYAALIAAGHVHVLEDQAEIRGLVVLMAEPGVMLLDNVAVDPAHHGRGYGGMLLRFAEAQALAATCDAIRLYTHARMVENIAIYGARGYRETHRAIENGFDRVFMTKPLHAQAGS